MKKINLETIKTGALILMVLVIVFFVVTKKSPVIDSHKNEIQKLQTENKILKSSFDSLSKENMKLDSMFLVNQEDINKKEIMISEANNLIEKLNKKRTNLAGTTLTMSADEVSQRFTQYLKNKKQ